MMASNGVKVTGVSAMQKKMQRWMEAGGMEAAREASEQAAQRVQQGIKRLAPVGRTGAVRDSIGYGFTAGQPQMINMKIGVNAGPRSRRSGAQVGVNEPHAHLVALGTAARFTKSGARRGQMPANPFVIRGFQQTAAGAAKVAHWVYLRSMKRELDQ